MLPSIILNKEQNMICKTMYSKSYIPFPLGEGLSWKGREPAASFAAVPWHPQSFSVLVLLGEDYPCGISREGIQTKGAETVGFFFRISNAWLCIPNSLSALRWEGTAFESLYVFIEMVLFAVANTNTEVSQKSGFMWHSWTWWGQFVPPLVCHVKCEHPGDQLCAGLIHEV